MKFSVLALTLGLLALPAAFAQEASSPSTAAPTQHRHRHHRGFRFGLCVGQALAQSPGGPITDAGPGQKMSSADWQRVKTAMAQCKPAQK